MSDFSDYDRYLQSIPSDWKVNSISEISTVVGGGTPSRDVDQFWKGSIPWITPGEVSSETSVHVSGTREYISGAGLRGSGATLLPSGSLMITTRATLGARAINVVPMTTNQGFKSLVFKAPVDALFYYYLVDRLKPEFVRRASGTTFLEVSGSEVGVIKVPVPPTFERALIAKILVTLDATLRHSEAIIAKLNHAKQGLMQDLLTRGIDATGELRPPQNQSPHLYKNSPLGWIPKEWEPQILDQLIDQGRPIAYGILMPGTGHSGGVPVIKVKDIIGGHVKVDGLLLTSPSIDQEYRRSRLIPGDLLFTIRGSVGRTAFVPEILNGANITQDTARIGITTIDARFVREYLEMPIPSRFISTHTLGVAVQGINLRDVRRIPIAVPSRGEAKIIAGILEDANSQLACERVELEKLLLLKKGLMDDLLTGRVRVTSLRDTVDA